ncbi:MAG: T9SS type A sorting domain-containing protein [Bacteroidia bacterium]|nr:T9SS type A sorting domain-containing protein [Bacteroidia bacterium]
MRVSARYNTNPGPCDTGFDGEVEDYSIIVSTGVGIIENAFDVAPLVYPNPADGNFNIEMDKKYENVKLTVTDLSGKVVLTENYSNSQLLGLRIYESVGVYLLSIEAEGKQAVVRLVKN